jgi:transcriptional regulator with XRE-family HTH domain
MRDETEMTTKIYHYTECGLDNVFIEGICPVTDHAGEVTFTIPAIGLLHQVIAEGIVMQSGKMSGRELRFLRTEMGMTQAQLADVLRVSLLTISRWEREENPIHDASEMLIRLLAMTRLELHVQLDVDKVSSRVTLTAHGEVIRIDGHDPQNYHLLTAA